MRTNTPRCRQQQQQGQLRLGHQLWGLLWRALGRRAQSSQLGRRVRQRVQRQARVRMRLGRFQRRPFQRRVGSAFG